MPFGAHQTGRCPHCKLNVRFEKAVYTSNSVDASKIDLSSQKSWRIALQSCGCPSCGKLIISGLSIGPDSVIRSQEVLLWPDSSERPVPVAVEDEDPQLAADFSEAVSVLSKSKKASAALSRRCLQHILKEKAGAKKKDLADQIDEVLAVLPAELSLNVDAIRHVGNFAAHPLKSKSTGEIVDVEEGEAEWLLDVLEELFEYYYVAPSAASSRRAALNKKLADLGKPPLKTP